MNKKKPSIFQSQKFQKIASIILLLVILTALPALLYEVKQQQTINQNAGWFVPREQHYACGNNLTVLLDLYGETPSCPTGSLADGSLKSYKSAVIIKAASGSSGTYTVHWKWNGYWCQNPSTSPCVQNMKTTGEQTVTLTGSGANNTTSPLWSPNMTPLGQAAGQACGVYQTDFGFFVTDSSNRTLCGISLNDLGNTNNNAAFCNSRTTCTGPTATPTPTVPVTPPTDTPTPGITITDTPTPGITVTDTPTPGITTTNTPTPITNTPTPGPSDTPTPTTPNQATDTPTTVIVTNTPKPTLPPTGPSNTLVNIGIIGVAIAVIGIAFAIAL